MVGVSGAVGGSVVGVGGGFVVGGVVGGSLMICTGYRVICTVSQTI